MNKFLATITIKYQAVYEAKENWQAQEMMEFDYIEQEIDEWMASKDRDESKYKYSWDVDVEKLPKNTKQKAIANVADYEDIYHE